MERWFRCLSGDAKQADHTPMFTADPEPAGFFRRMLKYGVYLAPSAFESLFVSTAHSEEDLEKTVIAFRKALKGE